MHNSKKEAEKELERLKLNTVQDLECKKLEKALSPSDKFPQSAISAIEECRGDLLKNIAKKTQIPECLNLDSKSNDLTINRCATTIGVLYDYPLAK